MGRGPFHPTMESAEEELTGDRDNGRHAHTSRGTVQGAVIGINAGCIEGDAGLFTRAEQPGVPAAVVGRG